MSKEWEGLVAELDRLGREAWWKRARTGGPGEPWHWEEYCKERYETLSAVADWLEEEGDDRAAGMREIAGTHGPDPGYGVLAQVWPQVQGAGRWYYWRQLNWAHEKEKWAGCYLQRDVYDAIWCHRSGVYEGFPTASEALLALAEVLREEEGLER